MKKLLLMKTVLLLFALVVGSSNLWAQTYKKVTSEPTSWAGEYLIVYESSSTTGYVWTGVDANSNYASATISNGVLTKPNTAAAITIASITDGYSIKVNDGTNKGKYIYGTKNSNTINFNASAGANTLTYSSGVDIESNTSHLVFNSTSGTERYRYYKSTTYSGSSYKKPQLYKLAYTVTYDANGGEGTMTDTNSPYFGGSTVTVKSNSFTREGYNFTGWNTKANGSGTSYVADETFDISENTTLYAQWVAAGEYISSTPSSADIAVAGDVAEFELSTNLADPSYAVKYYTTAVGDVEASKPSWLGEVEFTGSTLDIVVNSNTGAARTAYLKVYSGETYSDVITINQAAYVAVTSVTLDITSKTLLVNGTITLEPTVNPDNASYKAVTWESNNTDIATVNSSGKVTAVAAGTATITVKSTDDPTKKATCTITVTDGSIDLSTTGEIEITTFPSFSGTGYKDANPYTIGDYDWIATDCMLSSSNLQMKASSGKLTSPTIKSKYGFTVTTTVTTNSVTISDGTNSASTSDGSASLTTSKTSTTITIAAGSKYAVISKIKITPILGPSDPTTSGDETYLTTSDNMKGWRAFYDATNSYSVDGNTKVYVADSDPDEGVITLKAIEGIPAGVPVILHTTSAADSHKMTLTKVTDGTYSYTETNKLSWETTAVTDKYRLGFGASGVGFYPYSGTPTSGAVILDVSSAASARELTIDVNDDVTGIRQIENGELRIDNSFYNLNGQKVQNPTKGLYILNGKKVIIK